MLQVCKTYIACGSGDLICKHFAGCPNSSYCSSSKSCASHKSNVYLSVLSGECFLTRCEANTAAESPFHCLRFKHSPLASYQQIWLQARVKSLSQMLWLLPQWSQCWLCDRVRLVTACTSSVSHCVLSSMCSQLPVAAVIRKPLYKCFIHMLRDINPSTARAIETTPRIRNPNQKSKTDKLNERVDKTYQRVSAHEARSSLTGSACRA